MTTKTLIFMNIAYLNGNFDGKLVKNLADGSVGRGGICARAIYIYPFTFFRLNYSRNIEICPCIVQLPNVHLL